MAVTAISINSVPMPMASEFSETISHRGGYVSMANGTVVFDVVAASKRAFTLTWRGLTAAQKGVLITAFNSMATASVSFTPPEGDACTVTRSDQQTELAFTATLSAGRLLWETTMMLREV